jgi:hypothetical protein
MPRSGHRFLTECLTHYFGPELHYCGFYRPGCCHRIPCAHPHGHGRANRYFMQKSHDFGFRDSSRLNGKYLIQYRSPIPRLQSNYDLAVARGTVGQSNEAFASFAERETAYLINFYRKWVAEPRLNALAVAYEDLIGEQARTLAAVVSFIQGDSSVDQGALARALAQAPVGADGGAGSVRDPMQHAYYDPVLFAELENRIAKELRQGPHPVSFSLAKEERCPGIRIKRRSEHPLVLAVGDGVAAPCRGGTMARQCGRRLC